MRNRFVSLGSLVALAGMLSYAWCPDAAMAKPIQAIKKPARTTGAGPPSSAAKDFKLGDPVPVIACDEPVFDFGEMWMGPELSHTFVIKNDGDSPLDITRVKPACGCTKAGAHPDAIPAGKTGEFSFKLNSKKLRGKYEKGIMVYTNDPRTPAFSLKLRGVVKRYIDVLPTNANFGKVTGQEPQKRVIKITNNTDNPLELEAKPTKDSGFEFNLVEITPGQEYELHIEMKPPFETGAKRAFTFLHTNVKDQEKIRIGAAATVPERLDIQPRVFVMAGARSREYARPIRFTNYGGNLVKILEATTTESALQLTVNERTPGKAYTVRVDVPAGYEAPESGGMITLKTDDPEKSVIEIPIKRQQTRTVAKNKKPAARPTDALIGKPAPRFSLTSVDGKEISNKSLNGQVAVLDFFAVNCGFCKKQIPRLEKIRKEYEKKGVRFIAVSQTMRGRKYPENQIKDKMTDLGFKGELACDPDNTTGPLFKATGFPTLTVLGKTGNVEAFHVGNVANLETQLKIQLDALLAGKPLPKPTSVAKATPKPKAPPRRPAQELIGKPAPSFSFETLDGKKYTSADLAKHPATVLNFVAPNCGFCKKQVPRLAAIEKEYAAKGVRFFNVVQSMRKTYSVDEVKNIFTGQLKSPLELAHDPSNTVGGAFRATSFPTMVVVGKRNVEAVNIGNRPDIEKSLKAQMDALNAGKAVPKPAATAAAKKPAKRKRPVEDLIGKPAPTFSFETLDGKTFANADLGKHSATILNFVAPNCGFCKKQLPRMTAIQKEYSAKGVAFINVVQTMRKKYETAEVKKVFDGTGTAFELAHDPDNKVGVAFKARGFPTMVVLGKNGKVEAANVGNIGDLEKRVKGQLDAIIAGKPVPSFASAAPKPAAKKPAAGGMIGKPAPAFSFETLDGKTFANADLAKHPATILNFVAPNCGYCKKQLPRLEGIRKQFADKGVRFINVAQTMRKKYETAEVKKVFDATGAKLELAHDPNNIVGGKFQARGFPTMVVLGKSGKVEAVNVGNIGDLETKLKGQLDALVAGKPIPAKFASAPRKKKPSKPAAGGMIGKPAPTFSFETLDGKTFANADLAKHPATILNFVAPNCGYCKKQLPRLDGLRKQFEDKGVRFINVAQTMRKKYETAEVKKVFDATGAKLELAHDPNNIVGGAFKASGFPTMVVLGKSGKVEAVNVGNIGDLETKVKGQLEALVAGKPIPAKFASAPRNKKRSRPAEALVGKPGPAFAMETLDGKAFGDKDFANHAATVLNFVAPNCGYCKKQIPNIEAIRTEYEAKGIRFINVALTMRKKYDPVEVKKVFDGVGSKLELAHDPDNKVGGLYKAVSFPTMIVVDKKGTIKHVNIGAKKNLSNLLKGQLDGLIKG